MNRTPYEADVANLLDRLQPPPLSPGFADRVLAAAGDDAVLLLPRLRPRPARRRTIALGLAITALAGVAAAASVVPAAVWRDLPVIGALIELVSPAARTSPAGRAAPAAMPTSPARAVAEIPPEANTRAALAEPSRPQANPAVHAPLPSLAAPHTPAGETARSENPPSRSSDLREPAIVQPAFEPRRTSEQRAPIEPAPATTGETAASRRGEVAPVEPLTTRSETIAPERTTAQPSRRERLPAAERVAPVERVLPAERSVTAERVAPVETREVLRQPRERQTVPPERGLREPPQPRAPLERATTRGN